MCKVRRCRIVRFACGIFAVAHMFNICKEHICLHDQIAAVSPVQDDVELSPFTCSIAIHACASVGNLRFGQQIHVLSIRKALGLNLAVANSLVDMYCTCESILEARRLFDEMPERNLVTWNTIIAGSSRCDPLMAMQLLVDMNLEPNCLTLTSITSACAGLAALRCAGPWGCT